jgi:ketosteroid isomerase-like protein
MSFTGPLDDRLLIRERFGAYSDATFRGDVDAWLANYTDDGVWILMGNPIKGKTALRAKWVELWNHLERMAFFAEIGAIEIDGARAKARSYCREITVYKDGRTRKLVGKYEDDLVRTNGTWLFAQRSYQLLDDEGFIQRK